jgi:pyruvate,orthophosphate dikinase
LRRVEELHEFNPMLGLRGCRLGITYPEISEMQARAIFEAAVNVAREGIKVIPEVMIPLIVTVKEMENQGAIVRETAEKVFAEKKSSVEYLVGTMIELPRACIIADEIAVEAEFFSFGTNDLTQTNYGFSRDDIGTFLPAYIERGILKNDPFATIDQKGVGYLMELGVERGRKTRPDIKLGICGEHGGDPASVQYCHRIGLTYVSCSPFRVLTARLAAAQAAASEKLSVEAGRTK